MTSYRIGSGNEALLKHLVLAHPLLMSILVRQRDFSNVDTIDFSATIQIIYILFVFILAVSQKKAFSRALTTVFNSPLRYLLIFMSINVVSALWSPMPFLTLYRALEAIVLLISIVIIVEGILKYQSFDNTIKWLVWFSVYFLICGIITSFQLGSQIWSIPFRPGRLSVPLFYFLVVFKFKNSVIKKLILVSIFLMISTKVYIGIALGYLLKFLFRPRLSVKGILLVVVLLTSVLFFGFEKVLLSTIWYSRESLSLSDSSGRDIIWSFLIDQGFRSPILGYGFVAGETVLLQTSVLGFSSRVISSHNMLLSAFIGSGIFGLFFLLKFLYSMYTFLWRRINYRICFDVLMPTFILIVTVNISAPGVGGRVYGAWYSSIFLLAAMVLMIKSLSKGFRNEG